MNRCKPIPRIMGFLFATIFLIFGMYGDVLKAKADSQGSAIINFNNLTNTGFDVACETFDYNTTDDYYVQFQVWTVAGGKDDLVTYNATKPQQGTGGWNVDHTEHNNEWNYHVNVAEHGNQYGTYEVTAMRICTDGTTYLMADLTEYVSPVDISASFQLSTDSSTTINATINDANNTPISLQKYAAGNHDAGYFAGNGTAFTNSAFSVPSPGLYTVYAADANGYAATTNVTVTTAYNQAPYIGITQCQTASYATATINAIVTASSNLYTGQAFTANNGASSTNVTGQVSTPDGQSATTWLFNKTGGNYQYNGLESTENRLGNANAGDVWVFSAWYKLNGNNDTWFGFGDPCSAGWIAYNQTDLELQNANTGASDNQWHYMYKIVRTNQAYQNAMLDGMPDWTYSTLKTSAYVAGVRWMKIPAGQDISTGITVKKWAYGDQSAAYFDNNGTSFTGNSFSVTQNGDITVYAKSAGGATAVRTYTVANVDTSQQDTTPPTGTFQLSTSKWTTDPVMIYVSAADAQSGVKSITTPDGKTAAGNTCSYEVSDNGTYNFTLTDKAGNSTVYPVTISNIDHSVSISYSPTTAAYTLDPNNPGNPMTTQDIAITNNNMHIGVQVTIEALTSKLSAENNLGLQVVETASGDNTWAEIDKANLQSTDKFPIVLGVLSPGGTGHIRLTGTLMTLKWVQASLDSGSIALLFTAVNP